KVSLGRRQRRQTLPRLCGDDDGGRVLRRRRSMPSPFPGMDPYIETSGRWGDFHGTLIATFRQELNARLPPGYAADIDLYVWLHEATDVSRQVEPDVYVVESTRRTASKSRRRSHAAQAPMTIILARPERRSQKYIRIVDLESNRVVTAIEVLSPT